MWPNHSAVMIDTIAAHEAWWPPTLMSGLDLPDGGTNHLNVRGEVLGHGPLEGVHEEAGCPHVVRSGTCPVAGCFEESRHAVWS